MFDYHWPGNVRELENVIERSVLTAKDDIIKDISFAPAAPLEELRTLEEAGNYKEFCSKVLAPIEKEYFTKMIHKHGGDIDTIISKMGISKRTFYNRIKEYNILIEEAIS